MALRLARGLSGPRRIELGYGVFVSHRPFGYADLREAEATAQRLARTTVPERLAFEAALHDDEDLGPEHDEAARGQFARHLVKLLLLRFGAGWDGVEAEDGTPAPMTEQSLDAFMSLFPGVSSVLHARLIEPWAELESEGNVSALSPHTATAEA
ncbi:hypothetical protein AL035_17765 [Salipiger aestuarii]|uniref:Uncharacterized protein n=1 Tax=Salipiger aestuarii TaxID=568098 RepID=A0A327Z1J9_9RHOB|nr:hypothetical protein [Salipiger aestuarii]KAB2539657.1 hypothetical protein AL035_17765 [Salipiger aestuarii]RAK24109.1 hypothetical protein ATI53_1001216 [Salipiger aestuarii]